MTLDELDFEKAFLGIEAEIELAQIKEFRKASKYNKDEDGVITVSVHVINTDTYSKAQENAFDYFQQHFSNIIEEILSKIYSDSTELLEIYGTFDNDFGGFPEVKTKEELKDYLDITCITILDDEKEGYAYYGLTGNCSWDGEHGFGVMMHKATVIELGDYNTGSSGSNEIHKHNNTYTEEMRIKDEEYEKLHLESIEKMKHEDKIQLNKRWWQFWK